MARAKGLELESGYTLASLCKHVIGKTLRKPREIQCGNWSKPRLSIDMKEYAALDAKVSLEVWNTTNDKRYI